MRRPTCAVALLAILPSLAACNESPTAPGSDVMFRPVLSGYYSVHSLDGALVIKDADAWKTVLQQLQASEMPVPVDFTTEMLLLVQTGVRTSSGYSVRIERIAQKNLSLAVDAIERRPGRGCVTLTVMTRPYVVVALPQTSLAPQLTWKTETYDCS